MTEQQVVAKWGHGYEICVSCGKKLVWLYEYKGSEPLGAAVKFDAPAPKGSTNTQKAKGVAPSGNLLGRHLRLRAHGAVRAGLPVAGRLRTHRSLAT
jgi:hypothetical protein